MNHAVLTIGIGCVFFGGVLIGWCMAVEWTFNRAAEIIDEYRRVEKEQR